MPKFPGFWMALGPGIVWMALAQGSGELIWWPYMVAKYGLGFLFLLLPACLLQWPLTYEIGRYTLLTGESIWQGFIRLNRSFALGLWILMVIQFLWFGAFASSGGTALAALLGGPFHSQHWDSLFWGYATIIIFFLALVFSRVVYQLIEKTMWVVALATVAGLVGACAHHSVWEKLPEFLQGLLPFSQPLAVPWDKTDATKLLTAVTFAGLGGFWTLFYSYWVKEKGAGMAAHMGHIEGALGQAEQISETGAVPQETAEAPQEFSLWRRFLILDAGAGILGNIFTTLMTCLLSYAVLHPQGLLPKDWNIAVVQAQFFENAWGSFGRAFFLVIAAAFLADTWLSTCDAVARVNTDVVHALFAKAQKKSVRWWYYFFVCLLTAVTAATMPLAQPGSLILTSAVLGFVGTVIFSVALLVLNHKALGPQCPYFAKPGPFSAVLMGFVCLAYLALMAGYLFVLWH